METKKILMVTSFYPPYHVGGAGTHVYYLANALAERGHDVHVVHCKNSYYLKRKEEPEANYPNHEKVTVYSLESKAGILSPISSYVLGYPFFKNKLKELLQEEKFDLVHYHNLSLLGPKVLQYGTSKKIYTAHDHWLLCPLNDFLKKNGEICDGESNCDICLMKNKRPPQLWRHTNLLENSLQEIDEIIVPSNYIRNFYSYLENPMRKIPNFVPELPKVENGKRDYFLYAGMLESIKGIKKLIDTFSKLDEKLLIAGEGSLKPQLRKAIQRRNLHNIELLGWKSREELAKIYKSAKATILPSLCPENSPLALLESLSFGTPIMGSKEGGIPEIVGKVDKDLIFDPKRSQGLQKTILNFNQERYKKSEIRKIYRKHYSPEAFFKSYKEIIN